MKRDDLAALVSVLEAQLAAGSDNLAVGSWTIRFDRNRGAFSFDKCENDGYCEERPSVIALDGTVIDRGGPLFE